MSHKFLILLGFFVFLVFTVQTESRSDEDVRRTRGSLVKRDERIQLVKTEFGEITAVEVGDGSSTGPPFHLQFFTLEPNSLFLPVLLHADMVFYVCSGNGSVSWTGKKKLKRVDLRKGDVFMLKAGTVFFIESSLELEERNKLRIFACFADTTEEPYEASVGAYTSISDLVRGFDKKILASAFKVSEDIIEMILNGTKQPAIVHALPEKKRTLWQLEEQFLNVFLGGLESELEESNDVKTYNVFNDGQPDFQNPYGWSLTVGKKQLKKLKHTNIGLFMVNLTKGAMMGPHWNSDEIELSIGIEGEGMVRIVCPRMVNKSDCENTRFRVGEGDVFTVGRFHPMAQMSFMNESFIFVGFGFSRSKNKNDPQFLAGKSSVLNRLDRRVMALSFNVTNSTVDEVLTQQKDAVILECPLCAEVELQAMEEEAKKREEEEEAKRREEERKREEEEAERKREEEEAERKRQEEEEQRRREEEEEKKRQEEEAKRREEERKRQEEEEEEERRRREEEEEEERKRQQEEEEEQMRREEEEEEERKRQEAAARQKAEEEEEEERRRREEEAEREQEEARRQEEERQREREPEPWEGGGGRSAMKKVWRV